MPFIFICPSPVGNLDPSQTQHSDHDSLCILGQNLAFHTVLSLVIYQLFCLLSDDTLSYSNIVQHLIMEKI